MSKSGSTNVHREYRPSNGKLESELEARIADVGCNIKANRHLCEPEKVRVVISMTKYWGRRTWRTADTHRVRRTWRGHQYLKFGCQSGVYGITTGRRLIRFSANPACSDGYPVLVPDSATGAMVPPRHCWQFFDHRDLKKDQMRELLILVQAWLEWWHLTSEQESGE